MRTLCFLLVSAFIAIPTAVGEKSKQTNGYSWLEKDLSQKMEFLTGYGEGMGSARIMLGAALLVKGRKLEANGGKPLTDFMDFSGATYGQYVDGLDEFYRDFRNKRILFRYAMQYVRDQIRGEPRSDLEKRVEVLRREVLSPDYEQ